MKRALHLLYNLLATIHRDGGHYTARHGLQASFDRAMDLSDKRIYERDSSEEETLP